MDKNDIVIINLDRPRQLWFGHKAIKTLGALTGKDFDEMEGDFNLEEVEKIMYCLLLKDAKENGETLKLEDMEDLLDYVPFGVVVEKMQEAMNKGMGNFGDTQGKNSQGIAAVETSGVGKNP
jgi:hypothetical protein